MRLTQKGQVTVPKCLRDHFGLKTGSEVEFESTPAGLLLKPSSQGREKDIAKRIRSVRGSADAGLSTAEIMRLSRG